MKRLFLISGAIFILLFFTYLVLSGLKKPSKIQSPEKNTEISSAPVNHELNKKINVSGVETNDFLTRPIRSSVDGAVLFLKTENLEAVYYKKGGQFNLVISSSSAQARNQAEQDFLKKLGISKKDACRLNITVNSPYVPNPYLSLPRKTLTFCNNY